MIDLKNLTIVEAQKKLESKEIGLPRDMHYQVKMAGYRDLSPENIQWYLRPQNKDGGGCDINTWDPNIWKRVSTKLLSSSN